MDRIKLSPRLAIGIIIAIFFGFALYLRVGLPYDQVFAGDWVKFASFDGYYHMRLIDNIVANFPHNLSFDAYTYYPYGSPVSWFPFFDWFLAAIIWVIGLGSPSQHTINVIGAYFPAILGALTVIPVYFIGKELFNRWVGVISAGLIALMPGEFLSRSILGFTDHHVAETLLAATTILFLILAIKSARQKGLTFDHLKRRDWAVITRPLIYSLLAGIFLGIYLTTWAGALLFVFIIFTYFIVQFIVNHLRGETNDRLGIIGVITFSIALIMLLPVTQKGLYLVPMVIALLAPPVLIGISRLMTRRGIRPAYYPLALLGLGAAGVAILYLISPSFVNGMLGQFRGIFGWHTGTETVLEMQSLLFQGGFSLQIAWGNFTTGFFLSFISLGLLIYLAIKRGSAERNLFLIWSLIILAATLGQRRFAYYYAVNVALLTGYVSVLIFFAIRSIIAYLRDEPTKYLSWSVLESPDVGQLITRVKEIPPKIMKKKKKGKVKRPPRTGFQLTVSHMTMALASIAIFLLVFLPNISPAVATGKDVSFAPDDAWCNSLSWLRENTPEPFGDPDFYYQRYESPPPGENYNYPQSAYGVMAWWDYGHWITRIGRRIPNATPAVWGSCPSFFSKQDEAKANRIMDELGIRYIIVDHAIASVDEKFWALPTLIGRNYEEFFDVYYQWEEDAFKATWVFYPEYYQTTVIKLYNFDGKAVTPESSTVISYDILTGDGETYKVITSSQSFPTYEEASAYVSAQSQGNYRIVGTDPFISPVPLDEMEHYSLIYSSEFCIMEQGTRMVPEIKIFEYTK